MNINDLKLQDISSTHIQVGNAGGVCLLPEREWCEDLGELYLQSQVSKCRPYSEGRGQFDKEWHPPGFRRCDI